MLYCPRCGDVLKISDSGEFTCERGQMSLSRNMYEKLVECYVENLRRPKDIVFSHNGKPHPIGGKWFCPGCGIRINESSPGSLVCAKCKKSVVEFVPALIERHYHAPEFLG